jgi:eukaryotic-like serine/threonine-protein kinase
MELPARISKYELQEFLGGGMSHVYRAWDTVIGRTVAVKILTDSGCLDADVKARFLAEARMAGGMAHENVINVFDFGEDEQQRPYLVMEFLRGEDLSKAIKNGHTGELKNQLKIALQMARALQHIHSLNVIHRDIKPENVFINTHGTVKLMDFGIAKAEGITLTRTGYVPGTPRYMAPDLIRGDEITPQVDVYSFGVLLFELLTGAKLVRGETLEQIFYNILNEPVDLEPLRRTAAPQAINDLVAACTAKRASERPSGFDPIVATLERTLAASDEPTLDIPKPPAISKAPRPSWNSGFSWPPPPWVFAVVAPVILLIFVGLYLMLRPTGVTPVTRAPQAVESSTAHQGEPSPARTAELPPTISTPTGEMVLVPAGSFQAGKNRERASLPDFYIDRTEVTNAAYAAFCEATNRPLGPDFPRNRPDDPVGNVTIADARAFATWAGKRLPNALEWEKAARGEDGRAFPWGNTRGASRANVGTRTLRPANDFPTGASPYGALQMVGNVWELVDQLSDPSQEALKGFAMLNPPARKDEPWYMMRGQSSQDKGIDNNVIWDSAAVPARWKDPYVGFRCVKDAR